MSTTPSGDQPDGVVPRRRTARLLLRGFTDADREPFAALNADPVVMEHFVSTYGRERSDALVDRVRQRWAERGWGLWALERIGLVHETQGDFEHPAVPEGHPVRPHVFYRLPRERWLASQA